MKVGKIGGWDGEDLRSSVDGCLNFKDVADFSAIITDDILMRHAVQFFAPFFHGPLRVFSNANVEGARRWLLHRDLQ